jgi:hypothetical protein
MSGSSDLRTIDMSMSKTARRTWQLAESRLARFFGCERQVLSGSSGRPDDHTCSDATHPRLFLEGKLRETHAVRTLHDATRILAKKEKKVPVLGLFDKNRPGFLIVVHSDDWQAVVEESLRGPSPPEGSTPS